MPVLPNEDDRRGRGLRDDRDAAGVLDDLDLTLAVSVVGVDLIDPEIEDATFVDAPR